MTLAKQTNKQGGVFKKGNKIGNRFKPGVSGNPKGRKKKGNAIADVINNISLKKAPEYLIDKAKTMMEITHKKPLNMLEVLMITTYIEAIKGDSAARNFIAERTEGKALERITFPDPDELIEI